MWKIDDKTACAIGIQDTWFGAVFGNLDPHFFWEKAKKNLRIF